MSVSQGICMRVSWFKVSVGLVVVGGVTVWCC